MQNIKSSLVIIVACLFSLLSNAQIPFVAKTFNTDSFEYANTFCETPSQQYFFAGERVNKDSTGFVFLTDKLGNLRHHRFVANNSKIYLSHCIANPDFTINIYGYQYNYVDSMSYYFYCKLDTALNIIELKNNILIDSGMLKKEPNFHYSISIRNSIYSTINYKLKEIDSTDPFYPNKTRWICVKQSTEGDTIFTLRRTSSISGLGIGFNDFSITTADGGGTIRRLDTNFNLKDSTPCFNTYGGIPVTLTDTVLSGIYSNHLEVNPDVFFVGTRYFHLDVVRYAWGLNKYNMKTKSLVKRNSFPFIVEDPTSLQTSTNSIIKHKNKIYFCGYQYYGSDYKIAVGRYDTSGKPEWVKYFKNGSLPVRSYGLFGCSDGGIMVLGYDLFSAGLGMPRGDFYIFKLDENGNPLSIRNISEQLRSGISLYPNPASDKISIKGAALGSQVLFYDMTGKIILNEKITANIMALDVEYLPAANYSYQVINPDGQKLSSGIWVKQ